MTTLAEAMLDKLTRVGGFTREQLLDDNLGVELTVYVRDTTSWHDVVMVYDEQAVRAYRRSPDHDPQRTASTVDPAGIPRLIPLGDVASVVEEVLSWPTEEPDAHRDGDR
jgi:hypothetical protein